MTDLEFDVLDELYFVIAYAELSEQCECTTKELIEILEKLYSKGWLRVYTAPDVECEALEMDIKNKHADYYYLASREGLHAHNRQ